MDNEKQIEILLGIITNIIALMFTIAIVEWKLIIIIIAVPTFLALALIGLIIINKK